MLDDRPYMRSDYNARNFSGGKLSATVWLIIVLILVYLFQQSHAPEVQEVIKNSILSLDGIRHGFIWQFVTFQFLHGGLWHIAGNCFGLYVFGRPIEERFGVKRFLFLYLMSGICGGILQIGLAFLFPDFYGGGVIGASAGVFGLMAAFALMGPDATILLSFLIPIKAIYLLYFAIAYSVYSLLVRDYGVAYAAHLGGILFAMAYMRWGATSEYGQSALAASGKSLFRWKPKKQTTSNRPAKVSGSPAKNLPPEEFISQQVDPILDKISAKGIQSLTEKEREILQAARNRMSKR